jgi:hypothetical protein
MSAENAAAFLLTTRAKTTLFARRRIERSR